jgi:hypothetical protein
MDSQAVDFRRKLSLVERKDLLIYLTHPAGVLVRGAGDGRLLVSQTDGLA